MLRNQDDQWIQCGKTHFFKHGDSFETDFECETPIWTNEIQIQKCCPGIFDV